jgi:hypothetical protein
MHRKDLALTVDFPRKVGSFSARTLRSGTSAHRYAVRFSADITKDLQMISKSIGGGLLAAVASVSLAACGGGGSSGSSPVAVKPGSAVPNAHGVLKFTFSHTKKLTTLKPRYVSPSTTNVALLIDGTGTPIVCTVNATAPTGSGSCAWSTTAGNHIFVVIAADAAAPTPHILSLGATQTATYVVGDNVSPSLTLDGVASTFAIVSIIPDSPPATGVITFGVGDAASNAIVTAAADTAGNIGTFANGPVTLATTDAGNLLTLGTTTVVPDALGDDYTTTYTCAPSPPNGTETTAALIVNQTNATPSIESVAGLVPGTYLYGSQIAPPALDVSEGAANLIDCSATSSDLSIQSQRRAKAKHQ